MAKQSKPKASAKADKKAKPDEAVERRQDVNQPEPGPAFSGDPVGQDQSGASAEAGGTDGAPVGDKHLTSEEIEDINKGTKHEYEVLDAGAIIDDVIFPNAKAKKGEEMRVKCTARRAEQLMAGGVRLSKVD